MEVSSLLSTRGLAFTPCNPLAARKRPQVRHTSIRPRACPLPVTATSENVRGSSHGTVKTNPSTTQSTSTPSTITSSSYPDVGFIGKAGVTGTTCTNLFPLPILGGYGWFLTVYDRDVAASVGPFTARIESPYTIKLGFRPGTKQKKSDLSETHQTITGIAAGNINVKSVLQQLGAINKPHEVTFFERGKSELFFQRRNEISVPSSSQEDEQSTWLNDPAPTYRVISSSNSPAFEVRELYPGIGSRPRDPAVFEWFGMNLFPIFPLAKYSAFVCVWRQQRNTSGVAIDKRGKELHLRVFDALPLPDNCEIPTPVARFAVRKFTGATSDTSVAKNHSELLQALDTSQSLKHASDTDFRVVVDNTPNTLTQKRCNEIWVELE